MNVAARVSAEAAGGEVLLTDATLAEAGELDDVEYHERGHKRLKNIQEPVGLHSAFRAGGRAEG